MRIGRVFRSHIWVTVLLALAATFQSIYILLSRWNGIGEGLKASSQFSLAALAVFLFSVGFWTVPKKLRVIASYYAGAAFLAVMASMTTFSAQLGGEVPQFFQLAILFDENAWEDFIGPLTLLIVLTIYILPIAGINASARTKTQPETSLQKQPTTVFPEAVTQPVPELETSPSAQIVVRILEELINETKARARFVLSAIFFLLVMAILVIVFAARIISLDASAGAGQIDYQRRVDNQIQVLDKAREALEKAFAQRDALARTLRKYGYDMNREEDGRLSFKDLSDIRHSNALAQLSATDGDQTARFLKLRKQILESSEFADFRAKSDEVATKAEQSSQGAWPREAEEFLIDLTNSVVAANRTVARGEKSVGSAENLLATYREDERRAESAREDALSKNGEQDFSFLVASGITRFGIVAIIVYIIQILVSLYRYNMRLSHFYASRMQAFLVGEREGRAIDFYSDFFDSQTVGFGKEAASPSTEISELIKKGFEEAAKVATRTTKG